MKPALALSHVAAWCAVTLLLIEQSPICATVAFVAGGVITLILADD